MHAQVNVWWRAAQVVAMGGWALASFACAATVETRDPVTGEAEVTYVDAPPLALATYPHESYQGREVYLVGDRWQYQAVGGRWVTYRHEPDDLLRRRPHQQMTSRP